MWALEALPDVELLAAEGYVNSPGDARLADVTARIERDGTSARIVLHYFEPEAKLPGNVQIGGAIGGAPRRLIRMTLEIPEVGDSAWRREAVSWVDPAVSPR